MRKILERLYAEPVAVRGAIAAVLNVLVVSGVLDVAASSKVDEVVQALGLVVANLALILGARRRVTPTR